jgi:hypothetical protein
MGFLRCEACGAKALCAASQCPLCLHLFDRHDATGRRVELRRCRGCDIMHRVDRSCHWCGDTPVAASNPWALRIAAAAGVAAVLWVGAVLDGSVRTLRVGVEGAEASARMAVARAASGDAALHVRPDAALQVRPDAALQVRPDARTSSARRTADALPDASDGRAWAPRDPLPTGEALARHAVRSLDEAISRSEVLPRSEVISQSDVRPRSEVISQSDVRPRSEVIAQSDVQPEAVLSLVLPTVVAAATAPLADPARIATRPPDPWAALARTSDDAGVFHRTRPVERADGGAPPPDTSARWQPAVARTWVNVRSDASLEGEVVGVVSPDARALLGAKRRGWQRITLDGVSGWVDPRLFASENTGS